MTNELATYKGADTLDGMTQLAQMLSKADGMIPKHLLGHPGKILAAVLTGRELGVGPMAAMRNFHVVEGRPVADYSFWIAQLKRASYRVEWLESTAERATLRLTAPDGTQHTETWDKDRAMRAGLWGRNTWKVYPDTMLRARCVTSAGRAFAAEVMSGCYELDEEDELRTIDTSPTAPTGETGVKRLAARIGADSAPAAAADAPPSYDAGDPTQPYEDAHSAYNAILAADTATALGIIGARIKASGFTPEQQDELRPLFTERHKELSKQLEPEPQQ